ncbi:methyltransferase [Arenibacter sp. GZD96]|uniref:tRNA1(Val) (adenine(37)-N6)-methyltransferase n=1 Tax=Aurantibrevibacter litoralis TaxID=3106030 RepID=UPI002AFE492B|nr:methyltransferase [Arenibacter sp. GZD-96]MEA1784766.1 methyltransferase [Arenibacter sp. GZD-96]
MGDAFQFKQFTIQQDQCAMKIGTDGVLLGAWTTLAHTPETILDIGTGTGLIALMLAQRSTAATIDALEIEDKAFEQCVANFEASPWADRLFCYHAGFDEFVAEITDTYDLIVSNPPFYSDSVASGAMPRDLARNSHALPFSKLLSGVSKLLSKIGIFTVIIPFKEEEAFKAMAYNFGLYPNQITRTKGHPNSEIKRSLMAFSFTKRTHDISELVIEEARHRYTDAYTKLTKDFYLKM